MSAAEFHQWLHKYCPLKRLWLIGVTLIFDGNPQIIVQRCQIAVPSSAADNAIFKNRAQNIECSFGCMARRAVLLKSNVGNIILFNFCEQKFVQHDPITIAIDCNGNSLLIFGEKWPNYAFGRKSAPNSDSFWVRRLFNVCVRVFCAQNATILLVYIPVKIKMSFLWKDDFFLYSSIFARRKDKTNYSSNQTWAKSSNSWNKNSWKKNFGWRTLYLYLFYNLII